MGPVSALHVNGLVPFAAGSRFGSNGFTRGFSNIWDSKSSVSSFQTNDGTSQIKGQLDDTLSDVKTESSAIIDGVPVAFGFGHSVGRSASGPDQVISRFACSMPSFGRTTPSFDHTAPGADRAESGFGHAKSDSNRVIIGFNSNTPGYNNGSAASKFGRATSGFGDTASGLGRTTATSTPPGKAGYFPGNGGRQTEGKALSGITNKLKQKKFDNQSRIIASNWSVASSSGLASGNFSHAGSRSTLNADDSFEHRNTGFRGNIFSVSARESHNPQGSRKQDRGCFKCGETGHISRNCTAGRKCFICGGSGHESRECASRRSRSASVTAGRSRFPSDSAPLTARSLQVRGSRSKSRHVPTEPPIDELFEKTKIKSGSHFDEFYKATVLTSQNGRTVPVSTWENFDLLAPQLQQNVKKSEYTKLTPVQQYTMSIISQGYDVMACAPTGSGKTAAYLLPIMSLLLEDGVGERKQESRIPLCLVLAPTRELALQIHNEARKFSYGTLCKSAVVYGGTNTLYQKHSLDQAAWILVATVGRLYHFVEERVLSLKKVQYLVFDEADRMLDMGFGEDIDRLMTNSDINRQKLQTIMVSATFPGIVQSLAGAYLKQDYIKVTVDNLGIANRCIRQEFIEIDGDKKKDRLLDLLNIDITTYSVKDEKSEQKTLVFVKNKKFADVLAGVLNQTGLPAVSIHGDRFQFQREEALRYFREGLAPVLVATSVAERGLDICGVDHVINFDLPDDREEYVHRIGRTGRVGNAGRSTSFYDRSTDIYAAKWLTDVLSEVEQKAPAFLLRDAGLYTMNFDPAIVGFTGFPAPPVLLDANTIMDEDDEWQ